MQRVLLAITLTLAALVADVPGAAALTSTGCAAGQTPAYVFGFADLSAWLDANMGAPVTCEYADPQGTGDTEQNTTNGLAFWRKSTNTPTFTDGWQHWALTPTGRVTWFGASIDPPADAASVPYAWLPGPRTKTGGCTSVGGLPDPACTPGALNPDVTQATIGSTICVSGYTARVRPPTSYTSPLEVQLLAAYGQPNAPADYELDHLISLELGGDPRDPANLWPQAYAGQPNARQKDRVETNLRTRVCRGELTLSAAQRMIATDWVSVYSAIASP